MPTITIDTQTFDRLAVAASLSGSSISELVRSLVEERISLSRPTDNPLHKDVTGTAIDDQLIGVYKIYKGHRINGAFDPATSAVRIQSAPWAGKEFSSPTAAAIAVVKHFSPNRAEPNTNGRRFWKVKETGRNLDTIIGQR